MQDSNKKTAKVQEGRPGIRIISDSDPYPAADIQQKLLQPRRLTAYFLILDR